MNPAQTAAAVAVAATMEVAEERAASQIANFTRYSPHCSLSPRLLLPLEVSI